MFLYAQISGSFMFREGDQWGLVGIAYSGAGDGLNNPLWQDIKNKGPVPVGIYTIEPITLPKLGPVVFRLSPDPMNGRSGFLIHWDNAKHDLSASEGCIIFRDMVIFQFIQSKLNEGIDQLEVVAMPPLAPAPVS